MIFWWLLLVIIVVIKGESDNSCAFENGILGECVKVKDCPLSETGDICGFFGDAVAVCCKVEDLRIAEYDEESVTLTRINQSIMWWSRERCNGTMIPRILDQRVSGGKQARPMTFRHMAILGYGNESSPTWGCGGSLISHKHILTAAHCLMSEQPSVVRLGDLVLSRSDDMADPQDFKIKKFHIYDGYKYPARYHDIAVIELAEVVLPTEFVEVACLDIDRKHEDSFYSILGWGNIEFSGPPSDALLEGNVNVTDIQKCRSSYGTDEKEYPYGILDKFMICAGGESDTCHGDSGGPLVVFNRVMSKGFMRDVYNIVGITSFGKPCSITPDPAIYTRVQYYLPWIERIVSTSMPGASPAQKSHNSCTLEEGVVGQCVRVKDCPLSESGDICGFFGDAVAVCCRVTNLRNARNGEVEVTLTRTNEFIGNSSRNRCEDSMKQTLYNDGKISGGRQYRPQIYRHMAVLGYGNESSPTWGCAGSLISHKHVLTAAHCVAWRKPSIVRLGDLVPSRLDDPADPHDFEVEAVHIYEGYQYPAIYHDIAILELHGIVLSTNYQVVACLDAERNYDGFNYFIMGWEKTEIAGSPSDQLLKANVFLSDIEKCRSSYGTNSNKLPNGILTKYMICAGGQSDICHGDSGGPLVKHNINLSIQFRREVFNIIGIKSFGKPCKTTDPGIYTRVQYYLPWIERIIGS